MSVATGLGKPVWGLVAAVPEWRMGGDGAASPWHPTLRLFRQKRPGDWPDVVARVAAELGRAVP